MAVSAWRLRHSPGKPNFSDHFLPKRQRNPMGDSQNEALRVDFDHHVKLEFHGSTVTSDAGLLAYRELDDALGLTSAAASALQDTRTGQNTQHSLLALLRQSIYSRMAGYRRWFFGENCCNRSFAGVRSSAGVRAEAPGGVHLGKIGLPFLMSGVGRRDCLAAEERLMTYD
jgi:hypothetical protein